MLLIIVADRSLANGKVIFQLIELWLKVAQSLYGHSINLDLNAILSIEQ
jgi:hypothetical protein